MNTLSFGVKIDGGDKAKQELRDIIDMQAKLGKGNVIGGINPATVMRSPELLQELRRLTNTLASGAKGPSHILQSDTFLRQGARSLLRMGPLQDASINWKQVGVGMMTAPFSPWIAARELSASGLFGRGGGGGLFGAGGIMGFGRAFLLVKLSTDALRISFDTLRSTISEGAKLYRESAKLAINTGRLFSIKAAAAATGLNDNDLQRLLLRGSHPTSVNQGARKNLFGEILGTAKGEMPIGNLQQIANMSKEFQDVLKNSLLDAAAWRTMAKDFQDISSLSTEVAREFKTLVAQIVDIFSDEIKAGLKFLGSALKAANLDLLVLRVGVIRLVKGKEAAEAFLKGQQPGNQTIPLPMSGTGSSPSPWERMGFAIGGFGSDFARQTAENTKKTAESTNKISQSVETIMGFLGGGGVGGKPLFNLP